MYWANLLHLYQPPFQKKSILKQVVDQSYRKITTGLLDHPGNKLTLNVSGCLLDLLAQNGYQDIIENLRILLKRSQIELTGSAKYHPFLPKLPKAEIDRQIKLDEEIHRQYFGENYQPKGFFPPEMGYSPSLGEIVKNHGFQWMILDESACPTPAAKDKIYEDSSGIIVFFRDRKISFEILTAQIDTAQGLVKRFSSSVKDCQYLLTAMDGETFGHHRIGLEEILWKIGEESEVKTITISQLITIFLEKETVNALASSWAPLSDKTARQTPFIRWSDPENLIHEKQWELVKLAIEAINADNGQESRKLLDKALFSDQFWWASAKPWWSLEIIEVGAADLVESINSCQKIPNTIKNKAKSLYLEIIDLGFRWQKSGKIEFMSKKEEEELKSRLFFSNSKPTKDELRKMIKGLTEQMFAASQKREYLKADEFKRRIKELISTELSVNN